LKKGLTLQPFPFIVGNDISSITSSYVYIDGETILLESPTRAVEIAFKFYHVLHCEYPTQSERVWIVLQKNAIWLKFARRFIEPSSSTTRSQEIN